MNLGEQIKRIRLARGLSQKEVVMAAGIEKAQFSRIENDKIDPSFTTIEKITKALRCSLSELFSYGEEIKDINSVDKSVMEKVAILEALEENDKKSIYAIIDGLAAKQKLRLTLANALNDVE